MTRFDEMNAILEEGKFFKVVCGAGNEDIEEVYRLSLVYTLAGASSIDVSADEEVVSAVFKGVGRAFELAPSLGLEIGIRPFINVSIGLKGDPHVRKALIIKDLCTQCGKCIDACPQATISDEFTVQTYRCIGCGHCASACKVNAVEFIHQKKELKKILPVLVEAGVDNLELHATIADEDAVLNDWYLINSLVPDNFVSLCIDRTNLSNEQYKKRVRRVFEISGERTIIQADGDPMSGGRDDFNTTLQAVSTADITGQIDLPIKILVSGGTNSKTTELAELCGVKFHGVSIGMFARKLVRDEIMRCDFELDLKHINNAVQKAKVLVDSTIKKFSYT